MKSVSMNSVLQVFARDYLKDNLALCSERAQNMFKRIYSKGNMTLSIEEIVDRMEEDQLDFAMEQVRITLEKKKVNQEIEQDR